MPRAEVTCLIASTGESVFNMVSRLYVAFFMREDFSKACVTVLTGAMMEGTHGLASKIGVGSLLATSAGVVVSGLRLYFASRTAERVLRSLTSLQFS